MSITRSNRILTLPEEDKLKSPKGPPRRKALGWIASAALAASMVGACHKTIGQGNGSGGAVDTAGYLAPPTLVAAVRDANGGVTLSGHAPGDAEVRLREPGGAAFSATATDEGDWSMQLPPSDTPRMFAFDGEVSGRLLHGEGAILALPAPAPVAVLTRASYGALPIGALPGPLRIAAVDYDGGGGGSISGLAAPRAPVRFVLDGQTVGGGRADDQGRFALLDLNARAPFGPGAHTVRIESPSGSAQVELTVTSAKDLGEQAFRTVREAGVWRTDWRSPGGGVQTTLVFDAASPVAAKS